MFHFLNYLNVFVDVHILPFNFVFTQSPVQLICLPAFILSDLLLNSVQTMVWTLPFLHPGKIRNVFL